MGNKNKNAISLASLTSAERKVLEAFRDQTKKHIVLSLLNITPTEIEKLPAFLSEETGTC